jgi:hypothetical protein
LSATRELPSREQRDQLLNGCYGHDPQPPRCEQHSDPKATKHQCGVCNTFNQWRIRMTKRFHRRGLRLVLKDRTYEPDRPETAPPPCPDRHGDVSLAARQGCQPCRLLRNWRAREYRRLHDQGVALTITDCEQISHHVKLLRDSGMPPTSIARAAQCGEATVRRLLRGGTASQFMLAAAGQRILAIPAPARRLNLVPDASGAVRLRIDSTGTQRRIRAACRAGHGLHAQARRLGYAYLTVRSWLRESTVSVDVADAVAAQFPTLIARPGTDTTSAADAARRGWHAARYFSDTNIDDPAYNPFAIVKKPVALHRKLRALARIGNGPKQVADFIGEDPEQIDVWMEGGPAPAYADHLVDAAFEALSFTLGPDTELADRAAGLNWPSPLAWHDIDINDPRLRACTAATAGFRTTEHPLASQVLQCLMGRIPAADLVDDEKTAVVRILHNAGWSDRRIAAWTRWSDDIENGRGAVGKWRERNVITGGGIAVRAWGGCNDDVDHIVVPSAA